MTKLHKLPSWLEMFIAKCMLLQKRTYNRGDFIVIGDTIILLKDKFSGKGWINFYQLWDYNSGEKKYKDFKGGSTYFDKSSKQIRLATKDEIMNLDLNGCPY